MLVQSHLTEPVNGNRGISPEMAVRLLEVFGRQRRKLACATNVRTDRLNLERLELVWDASTQPPYGTQRDES